MGTELAAPVATARASRWSVLVAFAAVGATTQLLWLTFVPVTSDAATRYGVSESAIGWLANVFPLFYVVLAIPAGRLLDRWFRAALALGAGLTAAGALVRIAGDSFGVVLAGQTLVALAQPLILTAITAVAHRYLASADRAKGIALASAATFAGMIAAFVMATAVSLRHAMLIGAIVAVVDGLWLVSELRHAPADAPTPGVGALRRTWHDPLVQRVCLLVFVPFGTFTALTTWAEPLLKPAGVSTDQAGILLLLNIVAGVVGSAVLPVWASRHHREIPVMGAAIAVTVVACVVLAIVPGFGIALVVFGLFGFLLLATLPIVLEITERGAADAAGTAAGLVWLSGQLGALVLTGVLGTLLDHPAVAFLVLAAATAAAAAALARLRGHVPRAGG